MLSGLSDDVILALFELLPAADLLTLCCPVPCCVLLCCVAGLGVLSGLSDDVILGLLELLPAADLARLGLASKAFYCFAHTNDLWKALVLEVGVTWVGCGGISFVMRFAADGCCGSERRACQ